MKEEVSWGFGDGSVFEMSEEPGGWCACGGVSEESERK